MNNIELIKQGIDNLWNQAKDTFHDLASWDAWNSLDDIKASSGRLRDLATRVVILCDLVVARSKGVVAEITSKEKRDAVVGWLNAKVDIPFAPEWLEKILIRGAVDLAVATLNERIGHDWKLDEVEAAIRSGKDFLNVPELYPWEKK